MINRTILKLLSELTGIENRLTYEGWIRASFDKKLLWESKGMGQFHLGQRNSMCEDLEVFNSILMVVFSFRFGQSTGSGQKQREKELNSGQGQVWGPLCVNK